MIIIEEIWKEVEGSDGKYKVSNLGRVWDIKKDCECNYRINKGGYYNCSVIYLSKRVNIGVHRLVGLHFIPNPENKPTVNHKIADKSNNTVDNLEWNTQAEQMEHVRINRLNPRSRMCCKIVDGEIVEIFNSLGDCADKLDIYKSGARLSCIGKINSIFENSIRYYDADTNEYIQTRFDRNEVKSKGKYRKQIYCDVNGKTYNKQQDCADGLGIKQIKVSKMLSGTVDNTYKLKYIS